MYIIGFHIKMYEQFSMSHSEVDIHNPHKLFNKIIFSNYCTDEYSLKMAYDLTYITHN